MTGGDWGQPAAASGQHQQPQGAQQCRITSGAVQRIYLYDTTPGSVVQVLDIRRLSTGNSMAVVRFRLVVSDGRHYQQAVVVTELNARIESGEVETLGLIKLTEVSCQVVAGRRVIIILGLEVVSCRVAKLGAPSNVDPVCAAKSAAEVSQRGAKPVPAAPPKPTPAVVHAESNVATNQQPQSAQQSQSLDSNEEEVLRLEEKKAKEVKLQILREAQLMDQLMVLSGILQQRGVRVEAVLVF